MDAEEKVMYERLRNGYTGVLVGTVIFKESDWRLFAALEFDRIEVLEAENAMLRKKLPSGKLRLPESYVDAAPAKKED